MKFRQVSREEFAAFLTAYPHKLETDVVQFCEPPVREWNDFSDGKVWPESVVAMEALEESMKGHPSYAGEKNTYRVLM